MVGRDDVDDIRDDPEAVAQVDERGDERRTGRRIEDQPDRV